MNSVDEIMNFLCKKDTKSFKCYGILKHLLLTNEEFRNTIINGIADNKIHGFSDELWDKLNKQNLRFRGINSFDDIFRNGFNLGYCTPCSKQVSYSLNNCYICGGILPILKGTDNCPSGEHTWIEYNGKIFDTTLMLEIDLSYEKLLGYIKENKYNPTSNPYYCSAKEFANDSSLRKR